MDKPILTQHAWSRIEHDEHTGKQGHCSSIQTKFQSVLPKREKGEEPRRASFTGYLGSDWKYGQTKLGQANKL
jgi:hypothetical protein